MRRSFRMGVHTAASRSWGPYIYLELGHFRFHAGVRRFGLPWHHGFSAWVGVYWWRRFSFYRRVGA